MISWFTQQMKFVWLRFRGLPPFFSKGVRIIILSLPSITFLLGWELLVRSKFHAFPFEQHIDTGFLQEREKSLLWQWPPGNGRNMLGLRNREVSEKTKDECRILMLGDSLLYSGDTSSGALATAVAEDNLNRKFARNGRINVINAGIPGYTTYQELEFLKIHGLAMKPDIVVLGFVFNDVYEKYLHLPSNGGRKLGAFQPSVHLMHFNPYTIPGRLFGWSYLANDVAYRAEKIWGKLKNRHSPWKPVFSFEDQLDFFLAWKPYGWKNTNRLIGEMKDILDQHGIKFMVVSFPVVEQMDSYKRQLDPQYLLFPQKKIGDICQKHGILYSDLTQCLYQNGGKNLFQDYLHLNHKGNDVFATELTRLLEDHFVDALRGPKR